VAYFFGPLVYPEHLLLIAGDFDIGLDKACPVSTLVNRFMADHGLQKCDTMFKGGNNYSTYYNEPLGCESNIDNFLVTDASSVLLFAVLDPEISLSNESPPNWHTLFCAPQHILPIFKRISLSELGEHL